MNPNVGKRLNTIATIEEATQSFIQQLNHQELEYRVVDQYSDSQQVSHIYLQQTLNGLDIFGATCDLHFLTSDMTLVGVNNKFVGGFPNLSVTTSFSALELAEFTVKRLGLNMKHALRYKKDRTTQGEYIIIIILPLLNSIIISASLLFSSPLFFSSGLSNYLSIYLSSRSTQQENSS